MSEAGDIIRKRIAESGDEPLLDDEVVVVVPPAAEPAPDIDVNANEAGQTDSPPYDQDTNVEVIYESGRRTGYRIIRHKELAGTDQEIDIIWPGGQELISRANFNQLLSEHQNEPYQVVHSFATRTQGPEHRSVVVDTTPQARERLDNLDEEIERRREAQAAGGGVGQPPTPPRPPVPPSPPEGDEEPAAAGDTTAILDAINRRLDQTDARFDEAVREFRSEVGGFLTEVNDRMDNLDGRVTAMEERFDQVVNEGVQTVMADAASHEGLIEGAVVRAIDRVATPLNARLDQVEATANDALSAAQAVSMGGNVTAAWVLGILAGLFGWWLPGRIHHHTVTVGAYDYLVHVNNWIRLGFGLGFGLLFFGIGFALPQRLPKRTQTPPPPQPVSQPVAETPTPAPTPAEPTVVMPATSRPTFRQRTRAAVDSFRGTPPPPPPPPVVTTTTEPAQVEQREVVTTTNP